MPTEVQLCTFLDMMLPVAYLRRKYLNYNYMRERNHNYVIIIAVTRRAHDSIYVLLTPASRHRFQHDTGKVSKHAA